MVAPAVSILMANYNAARFLRGAVQSVMRQTLQSWELIFVDDSSSDDSVSVVNQVANGDPRVRIVKQPTNRGPGAARNCGLELARGEWIAVLDSDDLMTPQRLETLLEGAAQDAAPVVADNLMLFSDSSSKTERFLRNYLGRAPHWIGLAEFIESTRLYSFTPDLGYLKPVIRTEIVKRHGIRYDERLRIGEDYHFLGRILAAGYRLRLYPSAMYLYRKHAGSVSYRMSAADVRGLIPADDFYLNQTNLTRRERSALKQRRKMLNSLLIYDGVISGLKAGHITRAAAVALAHPFIWPLLTVPIAARVRRAVAPLPFRAKGAQLANPATATPELGTEPLFGRGLSAEATAGSHPEKR
jgi:glycosyltransferase involved in cell wall biosynthesis